MGFGGKNFAEEEVDVGGDEGMVVEVVGGGAERDDGEVTVVAAAAAEGEVEVDGGGRMCGSGGEGDCG